MGSPTSRRQAFTLAEAAIALALLVAGVIMAATLFQSVLGFQKRVETRLRAAHLARNAVVQARAWLGDPTHFDHPTSYPGANSTVDGFKVTVTFSSISTSSPNRSFEAGYAQARTMSSSYLRADILVEGQGFSFPTTTIFGAPRRELGTNPVRLEQAGGGSVDSNLAPSESQALRATLVDKNGREIPDVFFEWSARPLDGVATLSDISRDGKEAKITNRAKKRDGSWTYTGGHCEVGAGTIYGGQETWTFSAPIRLQKP